MQTDPSATLHTALLTGAALLLLCSTAHAQSVQTLSDLGQPDTSAWEATCSAELARMHGANAPTPQTPEDKETGAEGLDPNDATPQLEPCLSSDPLECMHRVMIDTDTYPNAICSDGSPGAFYIRPGQGVNTHKWLIHLQGGAGCVNYDECVERWCGTQGVYSAAKMSTNWEPETSGHIRMVPEILQTAKGLGARGLQGVAHDYQGWTHVYVYYCSSDGWMGRESNVALTNDAGTKTLELAARGHTILSIVRKMLRRNGPTSTDWHPGVLADGVCDPTTENVAADKCVPDLDDATHIMFSGTSAGAVGAAQNADWFLSTFPNARTALTLDAGIAPTGTALTAYDVNVEHPTKPGVFKAYSEHRDDLARAAWKRDGYFDLIDAFTDQSCVLAQAATASDISHLCSHISGLLHGNGFGASFIETPTFLRLALSDFVAWKASKDVMKIPDGSGGYQPIDEDTFARLMRDSVLDLYDNTQPVTGVFAPRCGTHVGFSEISAFLLDTTQDVLESAAGVFTAFGPDITAHEALSEWMIELNAWYNAPAANPVPTVRYVDNPLAASQTSDCNHWP